MALHVTTHLLLPGLDLFRVRRPNPVVVL